MDPRVNLQPDSQSAAQLIALRARQATTLSPPTPALTRDLRIAGASRSSRHALIAERLTQDLTPHERAIVRLIERSRPPSLRQWDQIPMVGQDLIRQANVIALYLAGQTVAFVGDSDCTGLALALLSRTGAPCPERMLILDFDERLLEVVTKLAQRYDFNRLLTCRLYNIFDPVPTDLVGQFDWFYTNPPYGSRNEGMSICAFVGRGLSLLHPSGGHGCIILPYDQRRPWTVSGWRQVQQFLLERHLLVGNKIDCMHRYHVDDDTSLESALVMVDYCPDLDPQAGDLDRMRDGLPYAAIPKFYGEEVQPPYPRYIRKDGSLEFWTLAGATGGQ
jgi:hypothetical protein